ncbi:MAG: hypothetical protein L3J75_13090 [Methylococcaceae bacterium]|nr:hypothetical protein [Methylococcaceae bacterium]
MDITWVWVVIFLKKMCSSKMLDIVDINEWLKLTKSRNEITHEYTYNIALIIEIIVIFFVGKDLIIINDARNSFPKKIIKL